MFHQITILSLNIPTVECIYAAKLHWISSPRFAFLNPSAGERAVLVKTGRGDSMIIAGKWFGFLQGKEGAIGIILFKLSI